MTEEKPTITGEGEGGTISFNIHEKPLLEMRKGKFMYKGEEIDDVHQVYDRFNQWLTEAEKQVIKNL